MGIRSKKRVEPMQDTVIGALADDTEVVASSIESGFAHYCRTLDEYVTMQGPFDRQARVNLRREVVEVTVPIYLDYVASQVMSWSAVEIESLKTIISSIASVFAPLSLRLPAKVQLVKTSGQEEGYAAYTRRKDTIVLPANMVASGRNRGEFWRSAASGQRSLLSAERHHPWRVFSPLQQEIILRSG